MMRVLIETFGEEIIANMCIIYTRWGSDPYLEKMRNKQIPPLTKEFRIEESQELLLEKFGKDFPKLTIYFTDT